MLAGLLGGTQRVPVGHFSGTEPSSSCERLSHGVSIFTAWVRIYCSATEGFGYWLQTAAVSKDTKGSIRGLPPRE